jgi:hypothetical protein
MESRIIDPKSNVRWRYVYATCALRRNEPRRIHAGPNGGKRALDEVAATQISYHQASDPAHRFVSLVQVARVTGRAHIADREGSAPESPQRWGWRRKSNRTWFPQGTGFVAVPRRPSSAFPERNCLLSERNRPNPLFSW